MKNYFLHLEEILIKYKTPVFGVLALYIFLPSPLLISPSFFGSNGYLIALIGGLAITLSGLLFRALTIALGISPETERTQTNGTVPNGMRHICGNPLLVGNILIISGIALMDNSFHFFVTVVGNSDI